MGVFCKPVVVVVLVLVLGPGPAVGYRGGTHLFLRLGWGWDGMGWEREPPLRGGLNVDRAGPGLGWTGLNGAEERRIS